MDSKRLILFIALSFGILLLWQKVFPPPAPQQQQQAAQVAGAPAGTAAVAESAKLAHGQSITVSTDLFKATIDTVGGDLRELELLKHNAADGSNKPFELFTTKDGRIFVAQTGLLAASDPALPTHKTVFTAEKPSYTLTGDKLEVKLTAPDANGVKVTKTYVFKKGSYSIGVRYDITNGSTVPLAPTAYYRLLRDSQAPEGATRFASTFTGPAEYTSEGNFQKVNFDDITKDKADYVKHADNGWIGMIQHYFVSAWLLSPKDDGKVCVNEAACRFEMKPVDHLFSAAALVSLAPVAPGKSESVTVPLFAGPGEYDILVKTAAGLDLTKDYGKVRIFAEPLFWLLTKFHALVGNWGWAIILLTILIKAVFFPLTAASYRSMAKMKALQPRLERLKEQFGDDRMKLQQAMMEMYKTEKINPLGGCLPILIQIPVFIGLYWALLASVELRQAPWILWINDLSRPDPFYVLPILMAVSMWFQTTLNPPPTDPVQAKMMKIMPLAFSAMFFFFPSGLVLYYVVNNILSIAQQFLINKKIEDAQKLARA
jgi:YidC/Oxa1 family membrane protein insertase